MAAQVNITLGQPSTMTEGLNSTTAGQPSTTTMAKCHNPSCLWLDRCHPSCLKCDHLPLCNGCHAVHYCSNNCQQSDWASHRDYCNHIASRGASSAPLGAMQYYERVALQDPAALALARDLDIALPIPGSTGSGDYFMRLMRRLVETGYDSPENVARFFGSGGDRAEELVGAHLQTRMDLLMTGHMLGASS